MRSMCSNLGRALLRRRWGIKPGSYMPLVWSGVVVVALLWRFGTWGYDDPYITYRYAENLARGFGFVYNVGEPVLSTTAPLYALILAAARLAGADIPTASTLIAAASLALGGLAFWHLGRIWRTPAAGAVGLLLYPIFPPLVSTLGAETPLYLALILLGMLAYARVRYLPAAALLALAALVRADGVLAAAACGAHFLLVRRRPIPWGALALYGALLASWLLFAWTYFGAPFPVTLAAKQRQGLLPDSQLFLAGLLQQVRADWRDPLYRPYFVLTVLGLLYMLLPRRAATAGECGWPRDWLIVVGWSVLYIAAYSALGVTSYFWYYGPGAPGLLALLGLGVEAAWRGAHGRVPNSAGNAALARPRARTFRQTALPIGLAAALALLLLVPQLRSLGTLARYHDPRLVIYRAAGTWLREHTPPGSSVGALEVGIIGYYAQRRMIDFAGLIQPEIARHLSPSTGYGDTAVWAAARFRPDYLVLYSGALLRLEQEWAADNCRGIRTFRHPTYGVLRVYACTP